MAGGTVLVVGGTGGIGREVARHYHEQGHDVTITGRDLERTTTIAAEIGADVGALAFDLAEPETIADALSGLGAVSRLVLSSIARDNNPIREYTIATATYLATMKLVGYTATVHTLIDRLADDSSVVLFGGRAKDRPYPGSTTVSTVNGGVSSLIRTLAVELAPVRFNALHPGIVGDSPFWENKPLDAVLQRTPTKRLVTMAEVVDATVFLLENGGVNGVNLYVDGGWMLM
jgi:NAD(P)-dependent dehydrogenase (short-subunit alcohol dehydrogenase family)